MNLMTDRFSQDRLENMAGAVSMRDSVLIIGIEKGPLKKLTARQTQVLRLIAEGKTTKQVALELNISVKTVETHRMRLMNRLEIHDIAGLVRFAISVGLVRLED